MNWKDQFVSEIKAAVAIFGRRTLIVVLLPVVYILSGLANILFAYNDPLHANLWMLGGTVSLFIGLINALVLKRLLAWVAIQKRRTDQTIDYPPPPPQAVEMLEKEIVYQYLPDHGRMRQHKRYQLRCLQDGVREFTDRYKWTGTGECKLASVTPGFKLGNERKDEFWDYYDVIFPHSLHLGEVVEFTIQWDLVDQQQTAVPFLSTMIDYETKKVSLRVVLPPELKPKSAYCYDFANYIDTLPISTEVASWDPLTQSITFCVMNPARYHKYLIRWYC